MTGIPILSILVALPLVAGIIALFQSANGARWTALITTLVSLTLGVLLWIDFDPSGPQWQFVEKFPIGGGISWAMGIDGIALLLIELTLFLMPICIGASWRSIEKRVPEYMASFLLMQSLMIGVFTAQDLLLFYIFFEGGLIPMYLIIGIWGGAERIKASYKFFLYTLAGSVLMLIAMLVMIWTSGTTSIPELMAYDFDPSLQWWLWLAFFASFAVKMPMWPDHTWLPDAHVQAPTAGQDHRAGGRRLHVRVRQPGMDRPHRELHGEAGEKGQPQPLLNFRREVVCHQLRDRRRAAGRDHVDHRDQHQHRAEEGVEEELVAGLDAVSAAPDADDKIHRDQPAFEEDVE